MDWDKDYIKIYVDDELLNITNLNSTVNPRAEHCWFDNYNPFRDHKMYLLLNLALGGDNGGSLANTTFPAQYLVDYVRIYQKDDSSTPSDDNPSGPNLVTNGGLRMLVVLPLTVIMVSLRQTVFLVGTWHVMYGMFM